MRRSGQASTESGVKLAMVKLSGATERTIRERRDTGRGYGNPALEEKRQAAIRFLRFGSRTGWIVDRLLVRK